MSRSDFNGDGTDDILFYNKSSQRLGFWEMDEDGGKTWNPLPGSPPHGYEPWIVVGPITGALERADIAFTGWDHVFRTGNQYLWDLSGSGYDQVQIASSAIPEVTQWIRIEGQTDLTGDGFEDFVYQDQDPTSVGFGQINYDDNNDDNTATGRTIGKFGPDETIQFANDFDDDGQDELLVENEFTGLLGYLDSGDAFAFKAIGKASTARAGSSWEVFDTGDMTDDGSADIVWYNRVSNAVGYWDLEGGEYAGWTRVGRAGADWHLETVADFTDDGYDDILWRNSKTGAAGIWDIEDEAGDYQWRFLGTPSFDWDFVQG